MAGNDAIEARFARHRRLILLLLAIGVSINALLFWGALRPRQALPPLVTVEQMQTTGPVDLCPGESLAYRYVLRARGAAVVEESSTTLRTSPSVANYGGVVGREAFPDALSMERVGTWPVPEDAPPGNYVRLVTITAPGRVMQPAFGTLAFKVKEC
jgi:hypothetical protein